MPKTGSWEQYHLDLDREDKTLDWPDDFVIRFYKVDLRRIGARRVLEMGCGAGRHVWFLRRMGLEVTGADIASSALDITRRRLQQDGLLEGAELVQGDAAELGLPDAAFDAVLAWRFLHVYDPRRARKCVNEMIRLTRPGGRILLGTRSPRSTNYELVREGRGVDDDFRYEPGQLSERAARDTYFSREELQEMFAACEDVQIEHVEWTRNNGTFVEAYWSVTATRPQPGTPA